MVRPKTVKFGSLSWGYDIPVHYNVAVNGAWIGRWVDLPQSVGRGRFYAVKEYKTLAEALKVAKKRRGKIEIYESWGSGPEQRKVVRRLKR